MYPVSQDFHNQMKAQSRRIYGKIQVDYTDPFIDQSIQVSVNENANYSYPEQVADNIQEPYGKIASLDGSWVLDGTYVLAPTPEEAEELQMGWWGSQLSDENGNYTAPYPTLAVTFAPRPIHRLQVIADNKRKEWPVNFTINLYSNDTLMHTETVIGNAEIFWSTDIERVNEITKMELIITKWSHANRQVKVLEFFTSIQETYETDDILLINLLEEREVSQGSLPVGNISANEIDIRLYNKNRKFDAGNTQSPLYQLLKPNRRIKAWLRGEPAQIINPKPEGGHLWHFDRSVVSTDGIQPESGAVYTLRPNEGRFGGAVAVEEGTVNLVNNPTEWIVNTNQYQETVDTGEKFLGCRVSKTTKLSTGAPPTQIGEILSIADGEVYTASVYVKITQKGNLDGARLIFYDSNTSQILAQISSAKVGEWERLEVTYANNTGSSLDGVRVYYYPSRDVGDITYTAAPQLEQKPFATSFVDGSREDGLLEYPENIWNPSQGTFSCWVKTPINITERRTITLQWGRGAVSSDTRFGIEMLPDGRFTIHYGSADTLITSNSYNDGKWHFIALTWIDSTSDIHFFVDGQKVASASEPITLNVAGGRYNGVIPIGHRGYIYRDQWWNGLIDELLISSKVHTEEEIASWYNSNAPFYDTEIKEWVPLGTFWSGDWTAPEGEIYVQTTGRDRLELLRKSTYSTSQVQQNKTLYDLAVAVLEDAGLKPEEYWVDPELQNYVVPYAYFEPQSHREALRKIAEACLGQVYCDRDGIVRVEGPSYLASKTEAELEITADDYFRKDNPVKWSEIANYIEVETQPLRPVDTPQEVHRSNEPVSIGAGETKTITAYYNETPCIDAVASLEGAPAGCMIQSATYYAWGADVKVYSPTAGTFTLVINARPLKILNKERAIAKDDNSITDNGLIKYTFPANPLVQTREIAQTIANKLLAYYKDPRRDVEVEWRGNPALLLGDRVRIIDEYGGEDFFITVQNIEYDGGLRVSIEGRKVE